VTQRSKDSCCCCGRHALRIIRGEHSELRDSDARPSDSDAAFQRVARPVGTICVWVAGDSTARRRHSPVCRPPTFGCLITQGTCCLEVITARGAFQQVVLSPCGAEPCSTNAVAIPRHACYGMKRSAARSCDNKPPCTMAHRGAPLISYHALRAATPAMARRLVCSASVI